MPRADHPVVAGRHDWLFAVLVGADLQAAHSGRSRCTAGAISGLATLLDDASGELPACVFPRKTLPLSNAQNFLPLRGLTGWRLAAQEISLTGEARPQKPVEKHAGAESVRLVALVPKIEARCAWDTLLGHAPHRSASPHFEGWIGVASRVRSVMVGFLLEIARRWREKAQNFRGAPPRTPRNSPLQKSVYTPATPA